MQRGTELEPQAELAYEEMTGNIMEPLVMVSGGLLGQSRWRISLWGSDPGGEMPGQRSQQ